MIETEVRQNCQLLDVRVNLLGMKIESLEKAILEKAGSKDPGIAKAVKGLEDSLKELKLAVEDVKQVDFEEKTIDSSAMKMVANMAKTILDFASFILTEAEKEIKEEPDDD